MLAGYNGDLPHARLFPQYAFYLSGLNPETADLDLIICPSDEIDLPIR
jgi:hypothetical protein